MRHFTLQALVPLVYLVLVSIALASTESSSESDTNTDSSSSSLENTPSTGCLATVKTITCPSGETASYIPESSVQCAHYECISDNSSNTSGNNSGSNGSGSSSKTVLAAVLGTIIPVAAIAAGVFFYLHWRKRKRTTEAQHSDAKYMTDYNSLEDNAFGGNGMHIPDAYSSTYSISKWRDSEHPDNLGSHASIPIIFSAEYSIDQINGSSSSSGAAYRETRLYNADASAEDSRKWASPNVVNVKQKPRLVVLGGSASASSMSAALEIDTANIHSNAAHDAMGGGSASTGTPTSPETPESMAIAAKASAATTTQMPRIVQIGNPQATRAVEADVGSQTPGSPLRSVANGWDSESEFSDSDGGSDGESFSPAADANRPVSQATTHHTARPALGTELQLEGDTTTGSFFNEVLSATDSIKLDRDGPSSKP